MQFQYLPYTVCQPRIITFAASVYRFLQQRSYAHSTQAFQPVAIEIRLHLT